MKSMDRNTLTHWETSGSHNAGIRIEYIEHFDARGMRGVYGRGDHYGRGRAFHMDLWLTRTGRLLARFWSYREDVDWISMEVLGLVPEQTPSRDLYPLQSERWVPELLRSEYNNWILSEF
jgi:hypothetical protein